MLYFNVMKQNKAFTIYELIIVIVTLGILAAVTIPRLTTNSLNKQVSDIVDKIRYTQHLAMVDDKFDPNNPNWQDNGWCIKIDESNLTIWSNDVGAATDPLDPNKKFSNLTYKVTLSPHKTICFDDLGKPYESNSNDIKYEHLLTNDVNITASLDGESKNIIIYPETGFIEIE